jgi:hypothetical protein
MAPDDFNSPLTVKVAQSDLLFHSDSQCGVVDPVIITIF